MNTEPQYPEAEDVREEDRGVEQLTDQAPVLIDQKYNREIAAQTPVVPGQGVMAQTLPQIIQAAKLMARSDVCVPQHCRGSENEGICFGIMMSTAQWGLRNPFFVAQHSYVVEQSHNIDGRWQKVKTLAYDSAVFHAVLLASGALEDRPDINFEGEGDDRVCVITATTKRGKVIEYRSPPFKQLHPGHTQKDGKTFVKGSPLWDKDALQQQAYWSIRAMARRHFPDVVGGIYDKDEFKETPIGSGATAKSPNLMERLPGRVQNGNGFHDEVVEQGLADAATKAAEKAPKLKARAAKATPKKDALATAAAPAKDTPAALPKEPESPSEYAMWAEHWIEQATDGDTASAQWEGERDLRERCAVPVKERNRLRGLIDAKFPLPV